MPVSAWTRSTTPRRKVRESSLRSAGAEGDVDDAGERGRRSPRESDEGTDAAARRALNDMPGSCGDRGNTCHHPKAEAGQCPPAPAYRWRSAPRYDECWDDERDEGDTEFVLTR